MTSKSKVAPVTKRANASTSAYLTNVYTAAKAQGESTAAIVALLKSGKVVWDDRTSVGPIAAAFREGRMSGSLGVGREEAKRILGLKRWSEDASNDDTRRTFSQQNAYRAAVSAWSNCARQAGMPNKVTGGKRKARTTTTTIVADNKSTAPVVLERVIVPHAASFKDVQSFARNMAALMFKFEQKNAKVIGEYGALFDDYRKAVKALAGKEAAVNQIKTA